MVINVCVLTSSYDESKSDLKDYDDYECTPQHYFSDNNIYKFETQKILKKSSHETIKNLINSKQYDVYFNLCDGAEDEDRAGMDVVLSLEHYNVPFTGARSKYYELNKVEMKKIAKQYDINVPNHVIIRENDIKNLSDICKNLNFPVIIKHISGYGSVSITEKSKCTTFFDLQNIVPDFIKKYNVALIEEFIVGDEVTVLVCQDSESSEKIKVFSPVKIIFPENVDFKFFEMKWVTFNDMKSCVIDNNYVAYNDIIEVAKRAFVGMMNGIGYGRCDLRICSKTNKVYFLEINPNCGIMYPPGYESSADIILLSDKTTSHQQFTIMQIKNAIFYRNNCK
jgi:D-alanine-D-alanine ligase-like ATP-grasp enzyme